MLIHKGSLSVDNQKELTSLAWIALGGNQGNVLQYFQAARQSIATHPACKLLQSSKLYQTPALGPSGQDDYLNAVISIKTKLQPLTLLQLLQSIENQHGRIRQQRWGARTLDLDLLAYDKLHMQSDKLTLPHSQLHLRQFVLKPLCDIAPLWQHPNIQKNAQQFLQSILDAGEETLKEGTLW